MKDLKKQEEMNLKFKDSLEGKFVNLRKVSIEDANDIYLWRTSESGKHLRHPENYNVDSQIDWIKSRKETEINYIIYSKDTDKKVGTIGIYDVNINDKIANVGRLLLSEEYLKKSVPYGLEAMLILYSYVFREMNFFKITGDILGTNIDMFKLQKYLGMFQEGYLTKHVVINNKREDLYIMSIFYQDLEIYEKKINFLLKSFNTL
jgi:RimJ/RimL family protein N-acetyltransferase